MGEREEKGIEMDKNEKIYAIHNVFSDHQDEL